MIAYEAFILISAAILGAILGSFLNVVIYRLPRGESIVAPRSRCPECGHTLSWLENVPIVSYIVLSGRCRACRQPIPARYLLIELLSAAAAVAIVWRYGASLRSLWLYFFVAIMIAIAFIDWEHQIIPDALSLGGVVLGWVGAVVCLKIDFVQSVVGSLIGAATVLVIAVAYRAVRRADGMGGGDVKLMAMIGAFLGWQMVFPVLFAAALGGSVYGVYLLRSGGTGRTPVAFGSFLAPASCLMAFVGEPIVHWYLHLGGA